MSKTHQAARPAATATKEDNVPAVQSGGALATKKDNALPEYMRHDGPSHGNENVGAEDLIIPRLEIVQAMSPCLDPSNGAYIEGAKVGDIYNSVTRWVYGQRVLVVPVLFKKEWLVWRARAKGGGFRGAHATQEQADARVAEQEKPEEYQAVETAQQFVLVLQDDGSTEQAVVSMSRTKMKVSRQWNSLIRLNGHDRYSRVYILGTTDETNSQNQKYKNWVVQPRGFAPESAYKEADTIYKGLTSGTIKAKIDDNFDTETAQQGQTEY